MPYRRRRRRRRGGRRNNRRNRLMNFRLGNINAAGGRPVTPHSRTVRTVTCSSLITTITTCGNESAFNIMDWSAPADPDAGTFTLQGTLNNHPSGHVEIVADGFDRVKVLNAMYRFNVRFAGGDDQTQDYVFAYKFSTASAATFTHTAGTVGIDNWKDMRQTRGWVYKRLSGTHSGGSIHPSAARVIVRIANVPRFAHKMNKQSGTDQVPKDFEHVIQDAAVSADINCFLHVVVMSIEGIAFAAGDVQIDIDVFQKIRVWKNTADFMLEAADQE